MNRAQEFHYRLPGAPGGSRPGVHRSTTLGPGISFAAHKRLFDQPDPRRLDLRASLRDPRGDWLVRVNRQHSSVPIQALVDVSASMFFGGRKTKLAVACDFIEALGYSAFRHGDAVGMMGFDTEARDDIFLPPSTSRGSGINMVQALQTLKFDDARAGHLRGLHDCISRLGKTALVFIISDFHGPLDTLESQMDQFGSATPIPVVVWDPAETQPPESGGWLSVSDAESGQTRNLWLRHSIRRRWVNQVGQRKAELDALFKRKDVQPFYMEGKFNAEAMTRYFIENIL
ncbi:MAG: MxaS protein [Gammaproteobacteria bacterium]|nr:MxaS protein [Gammaproteobacteria bacterium]